MVPGLRSANVTAWPVPNEASSGVVVPWDAPRPYATCESAGSEVVHLTTALVPVTSEARQSVRRGGVLSMLMLATLAEAELPARSSAVPLTLCPAPSAKTVVGAGHWSTPDRLSAHVQMTATSVLFQPREFDGRSGVPEMVGGVLSILIGRIS